MTRPLTGRHVGFGFFAFFATIFCVNMAMAMLAGGSWSGLIAKNGYVASKDLALQHRAGERAEAMGWRLDVHAKEGRLLVTTAGAPDELRPQARALRPVDEAADRPIALVETGPGTFRSTDRLPHGNWVVAVRLAADGASRDDPSLERRLRIGGAP